MALARQTIAPLGWRPPLDQPLARASYNSDTMVAQQQAMARQMADILEVDQQQLRVQHAQLSVSAKQLTIQEYIGRLTKKNLQVSQDQLVQALRTVERLDTANYRLGHIDERLEGLVELAKDHNALLEKSLSRLANETHELITRGRESLRNGWYPEAYRDFVKAIELTPTSAAARYFNAEALAALGRKEEAIEELHKCVYFGVHSERLFESLAYCSLALHSINAGEVEEAQKHLAAASRCPMQDMPLVAEVSVRCDLAIGQCTQETDSRVREACQEQSSSPAAILRRLENICADESKAQDFLGTKLSEWRDLAASTAFERTVSHFVRELDDFVYLAPRARAAFANEAGGLFASLGAPCADLFLWTSEVGSLVLQRMRGLTPSHQSIMEARFLLRTWNEVLVALNERVSNLASQQQCFTEALRSDLSVGLLHLPHVYDDDRVLMEARTREGDVLVITCYYLTVLRNGIDHISVPLRDYGLLRVSSYPAAEGAKGTVVRDSRTGQVLIQGCMGWMGSGQREHVHDVVFAAIAALSGVHELLAWSSAHDQELFSLFLLLRTVAERLGGVAEPQKRPTKKKKNIAEDFEVVEDADGFEIVE
jgi:tetratricopeptide (TPR) repeat protein